MLDAHRLRDENRFCLFVNDDVDELCDFAGGEGAGLVGSAASASISYNLVPGMSS